MTTARTAPASARRSIRVTAPSSRGGVAVSTRGSSLLLEDLPHQLRGRGGRLAYLDADRLERFPLRLGGPRRARDDRAGVPHRLALRGGEARDVPDDGLRHVVLDVRRGTLLGVAADLADHHDRRRVGVALERLEAVDVGGADDRVTADADARREAVVTQLVHHLVGQRAGLRDEADLARLGDVRGDDAGIGLPGADQARTVRADDAG